MNAGTNSTYTYLFQPANATNSNVNWSVIPGTGNGYINTSGVFTGGKPGTVTIRATAADGSGVYGDKQVTVNPVAAQITKITLESINGLTTLTSCGDLGTLQLAATLEPEYASNPALNWTISAGTPATAAVVDQNGLVSGKTAGTVTIRATAQDGGGVYGEFELTLTEYTGYAADLVGANGTYKTYCYPNGLGRWMLQNSKEGSPSRTQSPGHAPGERGYYYKYSIGLPCPAGWSLPTDARSIAMIEYAVDNASSLEQFPDEIYGGWVSPTNTMGRWNSVFYLYSSTKKRYALNRDTLTHELGLVSDLFYTYRCVQN
ncbi:hypothetical protein FACS189428_0830 [Clostridia bacterium]|nr:hypothetical protein FACS189428_0830 [Clostridia bacterium]